MPSPDDPPRPGKPELELDFPFEFCVPGTPISNQNSGRSKHEWIHRVKHAFGALLPEGYWATQQPVYVTIFYFPDGRMRGDVDNIVKWIVDAMVGGLYVGDEQVERVIVQKFEAHRSFSVSDPTSTLAEALETQRPVVYIRVDDDTSAKEIGSWRR